MRIGFWIKSMPLYGGILEDRPLGGTETSLILLAETLAARQHELVIFCPCPSPGRYRGVEYCDLAAFDDYQATVEFDVFAAYRELLMLTAGVRARLRLLISQDAYFETAVAGAFALRYPVEGQEEQLTFYPLVKLMHFCDGVLVVGGWQKHSFVHSLQLSKSKVHIIQNGVRLERFQHRLSFRQRKPQLIYTSTPHRGLAQLLEIFPAVHARIPDCELHVYSGMQVYGYSDSENDRMLANIRQLAAQPGVFLHGSVPQEQLADALQQARVFAYPNVFPETFCIAVLEAQAAGLPVVATLLGALPERISDNQDGVLIQGDPRSEAYRQRFAEECCSLLLDEDRWTTYSSAARSKAERYTYDRAADRFLEVLGQLGAGSLPVVSRICHADDLEPGSYQATYQGGRKVMQVRASRDDLALLYGQSLRQLGLRSAADAWEKETGISS